MGNLHTLGEHSGQVQPVLPHANSLLMQAADMLGQRAADRDVVQERAMGAIVKTFNAFSGHKLTETEGWAFMVILKMVRGQRGKFKEDDFVDMAAYSALMGESAAIN